MELTLASAFSSEGMLGHAAYVFLIISMLMRTLLWLRVLVIVSAILGIAYSSVILSDPVSTFWESMLVLVNVGQLILSNWRSMRATFTERETIFVAHHFRSLSRGDARRLLDEGAWRDLADGDMITEQGAQVRHLTYIAQGIAEVRVGDVAVAKCVAGDLVGEMTVLTERPASASVIAKGSVQVWQIERDNLHRLFERNKTFSREIDAAIARNYRGKLMQMNESVSRGEVP